jgi:hypothetical protein
LFEVGAGSSSSSSQATNEKDNAKNSINNNFADNRLPKYILIIENNNKNFLDYEKIKNLWNNKKLSEICELYDKCFDISNDVDRTESEKTTFINSYLSSIFLMLKNNDEEFIKLVDNSNKG